jgi:hypothetical protein
LCGGSWSAIVAGVTRRRPQFLQEVAQEVEAKRQAGEIGEGSLHRLARVIQRRYFDPPALPNASPRARA